MPLRAILASIVLLVTISVHAQEPTRTVVIAPPYVQGEIEPATLAVVLHSLQTTFEQRGWHVAPPMSEPCKGTPCNNNACALSCASEAGADRALQLSLFTQRDISYSLALVQPPNDAFLYEGVLNDPSNPHAELNEAAESLLEQLDRGPGPWLVLRGTPIDATVQLDGEVIGALPLRQRVEGGEHLLIVSATGYADHNETIWVGNNAGALKEVQVALEPASQESPPRGWQRPLLFGLATASAATGLVYTALGARQFVLSGRCRDEVDDQCARRYKPDSRARQQIGFGIAGIALSVPFFVMGLHVTPTATHERASLTFHREF